MSEQRRVAVVTGAGSGIGEACAMALSGKGFSLVLAGRSGDKLDQVADAISAAGGQAQPVVTDVGREDEVRALFAAALDAYGRVDLLFNNAGFSAPAAPIEDTTVQAWQAMVDTNLTGVFLCLREAFRVMKPQGGGRIINNGSVSAHVPRPNAVGYTATKHAVTGLTRQAALEGRAHHIACGQIDIGNAATALLTGLQKTGAATGAVEPTIELSAVADAVVYMAGLPLDANVLFMTVMATGMPYIGRG